MTGATASTTPPKTSTAAAVDYPEFEIIAINDGHVLLSFHGPGRPLDPSRARRLVPLHEHDFYDAGDLATALEPAAGGPIATVVRIRD